MHPSTFVSEWLESTGADRERPCQDFASSDASVRRPSYRHTNLALNGIYIQGALAQLNDYISSHVRDISSHDKELPPERDLPRPTRDEIYTYRLGLERLAEGCTEAAVERFVENSVFPSPSGPAYGWFEGLGSDQSCLMSSHLIPNNPESPFMVSIPKPDLLYGYSPKRVDRAFTEGQILTLTTLHPQNPRFSEGTAGGLRFPFLAIQFKAAGGMGTRGDLWVAANECAGASTACLNAIDQLNTLLRDHGSVKRVDNVS